MTAPTDVPYMVTDAIPLAKLLGSATQSDGKSSNPTASRDATGRSAGTDAASKTVNGSSPNGAVYETDSAPTLSAAVAGKAPVAASPPASPLPAVERTASAGADAKKDTAVTAVQVAPSLDPPTKPAAKVDEPPAVLPAPVVHYPAHTTSVDIAPKGQTGRPPIAVSRLTSLIAEQKIILDDLAQATSRFDIAPPPPQTEGAPSSDGLHETDTPLEPLPSLPSPKMPSVAVASPNVPSPSIARPIASAPTAEGKTAEITFPAPPAPAAAKPIVATRVANTEPRLGDETSATLLPHDQPLPVNAADAPSLAVASPRLASLQDLARAFAIAPPPASNPAPASTRPSLSARVSAPFPVPAEHSATPLDHQPESIALDRMPPASIQATAEWSAPSPVPGFVAGLTLSIVTGIAVWALVLH